MATIEMINKVKAKAQDDFFKQRISKLSATIFPIEDYHPLFKKTLYKLLKYNSFKQMGINPETWKNMCTFKREFFMPEMEVCLEMLLRCTSHETVDFFDGEGAYKSDEEILNEFNNTVFPSILEIVKPMRKKFDEIDDSISTIIANKIESDCKISLQLSIGTKMNFIQRPTYK